MSMGQQENLGQCLTMLVLAHAGQGWKLSQRVRAAEDGNGRPTIGSADTNTLEGFISYFVVQSQTKLAPSKMIGCYESKWESKGFNWQNENSL